MTVPSLQEVAEHSRRELHFTGRSDLLASYAAWSDEWMKAWRYEHDAAMNNAANRQDSIARALNAEAAP